VPRPLLVVCAVASLYAISVEGALAMCEGPDLCTHAVVAPLGCPSADERHQRVRAAVDRWNTEYPSAGATVSDAEAELAASELVTVRIERSRAVPCDAPAWILAPDPVLRPRAGTPIRELLDDKKRVGCSAFPEGREIEVLIRETECDDVPDPRPRLGELLGAKRVRTRADVARDVVPEPPLSLPLRALTTLGRSDAPVVITAFTELICEAATNQADPVDELLRAYPGTLRVVHRSFIYRDQPVRPTVELMVRAALAAARQGKQQAFIDAVPGFPAYLFFDEQWLLAKARSLGLDPVRFEADLAKPPGAFVNEERSDARWAEHTAAYAAFPGTSSLDSIATARAMLAAARQGKALEMRRWLVAHCDDVAKTDFDEVAADLGMEVSRFRADFSSVETLELIAEDVSLAARLGTNGYIFAPSMFAEGKRLPSEWPLDLYPDLLPALSNR
jgi:predicted DsbA family dithiol-disulfide isomerase